MTEKRKLKKMIPYTDEWERKADKIARSFAPIIIPCKRCGHPTVDGYICQVCGCTNPSNPDPDEVLDVEIVN